MARSKPLSHSQVLTLLRDAPVRIDLMTANLTNTQLHTPPGPDEWSVNDVLAHIRSCADVWGGCIARILAEEVPTIRAINPTTWIQSTDYPEQDFRRSSQTYSAQRSELMVLLESLSEEDWTRTATVLGAGKALTRTPFFYAQWLAIHERPHLKQIDRIVQSVKN